MRNEEVDILFTQTGAVQRLAQRRFQPPYGLPVHFGPLHARELPRGSYRRRRRLRRLCRVRREKADRVGLGAIAGEVKCQNARRLTLFQTHHPRAFRSHIQVFEHHGADPVRENHRGFAVMPVDVVGHRVAGNDQRFGVPFSAQRALAQDLAERGLQRVQRATAPGQHVATGAEVRPRDAGAAGRSGEAHKLMNDAGGRRNRQLAGMVDRAVDGVDVRRRQSDILECPPPRHGPHDVNVLFLIAQPALSNSRDPEDRLARRVEHLGEIIVGDGTYRHIAAGSRDSNASSRNDYSLSRHSQVSAEPRFVADAPSARGSWFDPQPIISHKVQRTRFMLPPSRDRQAPLAFLQISLAHSSDTAGRRSAARARITRRPTARPPAGSDCGRRRGGAWRCSQAPALVRIVAAPACYFDPLIEHSSLMPGQGGSYIWSHAPRIDQLVELRASLISRQSRTAKSLPLPTSLPRLKRLGVSAGFCMRVRTVDKQPCLQLTDAGSPFRTAQFSENTLVIRTHGLFPGHESENSTCERSEVLGLPRLSRKRDTEQRWPRTPMNERHFPQHQMRCDDIRMLLELCVDDMNGVTHRMTPPRSVHGFPNQQRDYTWKLAVSLHEQPILLNGPQYFR